MGLRCAGFFIYTLAGAFFYRRTDGILKDALPLLEVAAFCGATVCGVFHPHPCGCVFLPGSSAVGSALGSGPRGRRFNSGLPDTCLFARSTKYSETNRVLTKVLEFGSFLSAVKTAVIK